jgi:hypothetical protein
LERGEVVGLDVELVLLPFRVGPADDNHGQSVVGRGRSEATVGSDEDLEAVDREVAPVGVVGALVCRLLVVGSGIDDAGEV